MDRIIIASRNKGKLKEFKQLFQQEGISVLSLDDLDESIPEIEETGETFHENAKLKAEAVAAIVNEPVIADDSGLVVDALNGRPGVYSARYAGEPKDDVKNIEKVLNELKGVIDSERTARFIAVLALARPGKETIFFEGICEGTIAQEARGKNGFGYDPVFIPNQYNVTMAQLTEDEKNKISHRFHALQKLKNWLNSNHMS